MLLSSCLYSSQCCALNYVISNICLSYEKEVYLLFLIMHLMLQMFIGDGAKLVRDAFNLAKEKAPAIIFIDELDAIGTKVRLIHRDGRVVSL